MQVAIGLVGWMKQHGVDETISALGGESTAMNTGRKGGTITLVENLLGRKLTWLICSLHTGELPLRHLIQQLDGPTSSDRTFSGPLGKCLNGVTQLPVAEFEPVTVGEQLIDLGPEVVQDLTDDQRYAYDMARAIREGEVPRDLANKKIGAINHSRWLTTASSFMRLYVSRHGFKSRIKKRLNLIVGFMIGVYIPCWFRNKVH